MRVKLAIISLAAVMPLAVFGQTGFDFGGGATQSSLKPWQAFKLNPKKTVKLSLANASADGVIALYEQISGITIVKDPALTGKLPVTSASAVSLDTAFDILNTTLTLRGYEMQKEGNLLVIRQNGSGRSRNTGPQIPFGPFGTDGGFGGQNTLKVYPIQYANATAVAKVINDVYSNAPTTGFGGGNPFGGGRGRFGGGGGGLNIQLGGPQGQQGGGFGRGGVTVKASSDDFSNSVIINAPDREQLAVAGIIKQIDKQTDQPQSSRVYHLIYAGASDIAPVVQNVLVANVPQGKGGMTQNNIDPGQRFQTALRFGSPQASFGQVASDLRTNSLVVTATPENQEVVGRVIRELDTPVETQTTTFVFPLLNAKATDVANLLVSSFGQRQGISTNVTRTTPVSTHVESITATSGTTSTSSSGGGSRPASLGSIGNAGDVEASNLPLPERPATPQDGQVPVELQDPDANSGELLTSVGVTQGFGGGFGGGQRPGGGGGGIAGQSGQTSTTPTQGRMNSGQIVNIKDLTGQVTAIPDPNTNSLIVVTTPDGADIIRKVLAQLDKIPSQVVIQALIVEASLDSSDKLGVEWTTIANNIFHQAGAEGVVTTNFGGQTQPPAQGFSYTLTSNNLDAYINALKTDTKFRVLSTPRIFTSNNVTAQINISQSIPYVTSSIESTTGTFSYNYAFVDVGIILTVTPQITSNGYVTMDVTQTANDLVSYTSFNAPIIDQRQATTTVSVKDNQTVILGGIIQRQVTSTVNKVPILGDIPILGKLFQSSTKDDTRTELLVFLTPRIVNNDKDAKNVTDEAVDQMGPETKSIIKSIGSTINLGGAGSNVKGSGAPAPTGTLAPTGQSGTGGKGTGGN